METRKELKKREKEDWKSHQNGKEDHESCRNDETDVEEAIRTITGTTKAAEREKENKLWSTRAINETRNTAETKERSWKKVFVLEETTKTA